MATESLFKRDALGKVLIWTIFTDGTHDIVSFGRLDNPTKQQTIISDSTKTSYKSAIKKKRDRGYKSAQDFGITDDDWEGIDQLNDLLLTKLPKYATDTNNAQKPMKCVKWKRDYFDYSNGAFADPKINGIRATIKLAEVDNGLFGKTREVVILSKEGIRLRIKHIEEVFMQYVFNAYGNKFNPNDNDNLIFDGELYIKGQKNTSIGGACRNPKNPLHPYIQFVNFDLSVPDLSNLDRFHLRRKALTIDTDYFNKFNHFSEELPTYWKGPIFIQQNPLEHDYSKNYVIVSLCSQAVHNDDDVEKIRDLCLDVGYEGCIVRDNSAEYKFGSRPTTMMKAKRWDESEFVCLAIKRDVVHKLVNGTIKDYITAKFVCRNDINGLTFEVKPSAIHKGVKNDMFTSDYILAHKDEFIGKLISVRFYERTDNKLPFNANAFGVRDTEL